MNNKLFDGKLISDLKSKSGFGHSELARKIDVTRQQLTKYQKGETSIPRDNPKLIGLLKENQIDYPDKDLSKEQPKINIREVSNFTLIKKYERLTRERQIKFIEVLKELENDQVASEFEVIERIFEDPINS
jgi:transcriptional regulator with XRE-family HTH domain